MRRLRLYDDRVQLLRSANAGDARPVRHVLENRFRKRVRLLEHHADPFAQLDHVDLGPQDVVALQQYLALDARPVDARFLVRLADRFAERSSRGIVTRGIGAWLLVGLPVIAARIWWSVGAAIIIFVVTVTIYVASAVRYMRRHPEPR